MKRELHGDVALIDFIPDANQPAEALPQLVSAAELYQGNTVQIRALFDNLLYDGLTMFAAKPKAGKSWFTLQVAVCIAGGRVISGLQANGLGPVLYLALEEPQARTMTRLRQIAPHGPWAANIQFVYDLLPLMGGGLQQLVALIAKVKPRLVVIDTLTAVLKDGSSKQKDVFRSQYAEVAALARLAGDRSISMILVHHTRKGVSDGAIDAIAGTGGIGAAIDGLWHLKRKPEGEAVLEVIGREIGEERALALRFDPGALQADTSSFGWKVLGDDVLQQLTGERKEILALLKEDGGMTPAQVAAELGKSRPAVRMILKRMKEDRQVKKENLKYFPIHSMSYSITERESE